tara:strand:- start:514 stop:2103 length:1590 start_codon:yes stop_codon:yes gene_type:complete
MKKLFLLIAVFVFSFSSYSQIKFYNDSTSVVNFPEISFQINDRDPGLKIKSDFILRERLDQLEVIDSFSFIHLKDSLTYSNENKCILVMIETLGHSNRYEQLNTSLNAINSSLSRFINKGDKVKLVWFALRNAETKVLNDINPKFTDSINEIKSYLNKFRLPDNDFTNKYVSSITGALIEGVDVLDKFDSSLPKSIILISEERNNSYAQVSTTSAIAKAREKGVVINTIKYNRFKDEQFSIPTLSQGTYGERFVLSQSLGNQRVNDKKKSEIENRVVQISKNLVKRSKGNNYEFSFLTKNDIKNGKNYDIQVEVTDSEQLEELSYKAPGNWVVAQFQKNLILSIFVSIILIALILILVLKIYKSYKEKALARENEILDQRKKTEHQQVEIDKQNNEIDRIKNEESERQRIEAEKKKKEAESELIKKMLQNGNFPILKVIEGDNSKTYEVNKPSFTVGRSSNNDLTINNPHISGNHFTIYFDGNNYYLKDVGSTNGTLVNGIIYKGGSGSINLNDGDIIEVTEITIVFYK